MNSQEEVWQVEVDNRVYTATIEEVIEWIQEGSVQPGDKVRRGSLRWLPAERVPELYRHFNHTVTVAEQPVGCDNPEVTLNFSNDRPLDLVAGETALQPDQPQKTSDEKDITLTASARRFCVNHRESRAAYTCGTCRNSLCALCPSRFGNVRLCPACGGMCLPYTESEVGLIGALNKPYARKNTNTSGPRPFFDTRLSIGEILQALVFPFRHWKSSLLGGALLIFLTLGISLALLGEISTLAISAACSLVELTFLFGVLWKVSDSIKEGRAKANFLPKLVHLKASFGRPFRAAVLVLCATFGPFATLFIGSSVYAWFQFSGSVRQVESEMRSTEERTARFLSFEQQKRERESFEYRLDQKRENLLNSVLGRERSDENPTLSIAVKSFMRLSVIFLLPVGLTLMFGLITFPAACSSALVSEGSKQILNPLRVLRALKQMGFDYFKLLFISIAATVIAVMGSTAIMAGVSSADMPILAFAASIAFVGTFTMYFWVVFSRLLATTTHS
jgi:hypothetical protein